MKSAVDRSDAETAGKLRMPAFLLLAVIVLAPAPPVEARGDNELVRMFAWWNEAMMQPGGFTAEAFARHFTDDASIIVNDDLLANGIPAMVRHFRGIQERTESVEIVLPFEESFREGNKLFTHHRIRAIENGKRRITHVMGYALVEDGRISLINFITHSEYPASGAMR